MQDEPLEWKEVFKVGSLPFLVLPFLQFNAGWFLLAAYLIGMLFLLKGLEKEVWILQQNRGPLLVF
ncbi:hypothetical protein [Fodinibius halophilus]|uniref:Uncharacterized protein n=1 Tax=Fodinibius halophilus TaxID=1736908 RepID=A0A6M1T459_9BACT|nr:hypothetical protein [Fodinibius halophilus]NGP88857.1 hypothetical protein [Fodinibius halophilus]